MIISTNAASITDVEDGQQQQQQQQQQPFALFPVASMPAEEFGGDGGGFIGSLPQMAKRRQQLLNALLMTRRLGRSPRASVRLPRSTMRNALVRFGKRALLPMMALDDKRNPPQPFVRFGRSAAANAVENGATDPMFFAVS
uniref:Uncharacterized protein n=1 Tax=Globodera pallida TaxID=36090 RepID=A0A183C8A2_GLOPA